MFYSFTPLTIVYSLLKMYNPITHPSKTTRLGYTESSPWLQCRSCLARWDRREHPSACPCYCARRQSTSEHDDESDEIPSLAVEELPGLSPFNLSGMGTTLPGIRTVLQGLPEDTFTSRHGSPQSPRLSSNKESCDHQFQGGRAKPRLQQLAGHIQRCRVSGPVRRPRQSQKVPPNFKAAKEKVSRGSLVRLVVEHQNLILETADEAIRSFWKPLNDNNRQGGLDFKKEHILESSLRLHDASRKEIKDSRKENKRLRRLLSKYRIAF